LNIFGNSPEKQPSSTFDKYQKYSKFFLSKTNVFSAAEIIAKLNGFLLLDIFGHLFTKQFNGMIIPKGIYFWGVLKMVKTRKCFPDFKVGQKSNFG